MSGATCDRWLWANGGPPAVILTTVACRLHQKLSGGGFANNESTWSFTEAAVDPPRAATPQPAQTKTARPAPRRNGPADADLPRDGRLAHHQGHQLSPSDRL